jgi:hypothetical protein
MKEECTEKTKNKIIVFEEKRSRLTVLNTDQSEVVKVVVDGCQINDDSLRCDYMFLANETEHYVELKGKSISRGIKQLRSTIDQLSVDKKNVRKVSFVICTSNPMLNASIQVEKAKFRKHYNSDLTIIKSGNTYHL